MTLSWDSRITSSKVSDICPLLFKGSRLRNAKPVSRRIFNLFFISFLILGIREIAKSLEFLEVALGSHAAILQHDDTVTLLDSALTVGNDDTRTFQFGEVLNNNVLADIVKC